MPEFESIINASRDSITLIDRDYRYRFANDAFCRACGLDRAQIIGQAVWKIGGEAHFETRMRRHLDAALNGQETSDFDHAPGGDARELIHVCYLPYHEGDEITHIMVYSHDISAIRHLESRLIDLEFKDPITGLFNRKSFDIVLDMELEKAKRSEHEKFRVILFLNIDNFNEINFQYGHEIGDLILESTGLRIKNTLRASDYVFRFEGKEFAVILPFLARTTDVATVAEKIWSAVSLPYPNKNSVITLESHIGLALFPDDGLNASEVVRSALSAMNEAKQRGEHFVAFNRALHERSLGKIRIKANIRKALVDEQFELRFQPVVHQDGSIAGAEALIRWHHPELGWIPPSEFIPIAEEAGDILMVGRWVMYQVCASLRQLEEVIGERYISVNLSTREFATETLVDDLAEILRASGWSRIANLRLEVTETQGMTDIRDTIGKMRRFQEMGFGLFIDDFGTGYSSLSYLRQLPAETIKIDKSFVDPIEESPADLQFLHGMVRMIQSLEKKVIIEGVANLGQRRLLAELEGIKFQGYHFSQPITTDELYFYLRDNRRLPAAQEF